MRKVTISVIATALVLGFAAWLGLVVVAQAGTIHVGASRDYLPGAKWFFSTLSESSIRQHTQQALREGKIQVPREVTGAMLRTGGSHYRSMCVICHGAPGVERSEIGQGMKPKPPALSQVAREMSSAEIYWVLQNGIRHTGMPAFGATHSAEDLWALAAFVEQLDGMSPKEYRRRTGGSGGGGDRQVAAQGHGDHQH